MNLMRKRGGDAEVFRITGTAAGLSADVRGRQRRYVISMTIRTICVVLAFTLWNVSRPLAWAALIGGALLPYIAVVIANAGRENARRLPTGLVVRPHRHQLEAHSSRPPHDGPR